MSKLPHFNAYLFKKVIHFEWILIIVCCIAQLFTWRFGPADPTAPNLKVSLILIGIVASLSFLKPHKGGYYDRLCYLFLELIVITGAIAAGLPRFLFPLFVVVVAKATLLLDRKGLIVVFVSAFLCQIAYYSFKYAIIKPGLFVHGWSAPGIAMLLASAVVASYAPIAMMVLVVMVIFSLLAEQNQRLETERLSREVQSLATELERTRIAREIHDSLGHTLTSLNIQLDIARKLHGRDPGKSNDAVEIAKQLASQSLADVRMALQSIRESSDFNFENALQDLLNDVKKRQDSMDVELKLNLQHVPPSVGFQVFRVIQECLTNVQKHADASEVRIEVEQSGENLKLNVSDNGRGMPSDTQHTGFGIRGMRERIESMNGTVAISAQPNKGTSINVSIPVKAE